MRAASFTAKVALATFDARAARSLSTCFVMVASPVLSTPERRIW
jgi:hypothetical protein